MQRRERDLQFRESQSRAELELREREKKAIRQQAQSESLRAYLDQMSNLVVDQRLREEPLDSHTHRIAQARTLVMLSSLDKDRKRDPLYLVYELGLINKDYPDLSLRKADLSEITLREASLREADFRRADLKDSDLKGSDLSDTDLRGADLSDSDLSNTSLAGANLLPYDEQRPAKLNAAHLANGVDPTDIDLNDDRVIRTKLSGANLRGVDLCGAFLAGVVGFSNEELELQASSLQGATMPNGQKYEEWLKSKGSEEDGENSDPS